jgi:MscS family membrane protein
MAHRGNALTFGARDGRWLSECGRAVILIFLFCTAIYPQGVTPTAQPDSTDLLRRTTPRGAVLGFLAAARKGDDATAAQYLNTRLRGKAAATLAHQFYVVLDRRLPAHLNELSDRPEGSGDDPADPDVEIVGAVKGANGEVEILLERRKAGKAGLVWLFSRKTLDAVPALFAEVNSIQVETILPEFLIRIRVAQISLFEWLVLLTGLPLLFAGLVLLSRMLSRAAGRLRRRVRKNAALPNPDPLPKPVWLLALAGMIHWLLSKVSLPLLSRQFWPGIATLLIIVAFVWMAILVNARIERHAARRLGSRNKTGVVSILRFIRRAADLVAVLVGFFVVLRYLGVNPTAAFAGIGVGGIAVALAAQKTLENIIGGLSLIFDQTVRVGDFLKVGDTMGTVQKIGLRSTGICTMDRTVVSVPNGQISNLSLENFSLRDKYWFRHIVGLDRRATVSQTRTILQKFEELLRQQPGSEPESVRARLIRFGPSSLDIEVVAYLNALDWTQFLQLQEVVLLRIMEVVEAEGTHLALPSQSVYVLASSSGRPATDGPGFAALEPLSPGSTPARRQTGPAARIPALTPDS